VLERVESGRDLKKS